MFSVYSRNELKTNNKLENNNNNKILRKDLDIWKLNNMLLNNRWIREEITRYFIKIFN